MNAIILKTNALRRIYTFSSRPFTKDFPLLLVTFLLVCTPYVIGTLLYNFLTWSSLIWETTHYYLLCYVALMFISNLPPKLHKYGVILLLTLAIIDFIIETCCFSNTGLCFYTDTAAIILGTNLSESHEFFSTHFSPKNFAIIIGGILLILLLFKKAHLLNTIGKKLSLLLCTLTLAGFCYLVIIKKSVSWDAKFYCKINTFLSYEMPPDLKQYKKDIKVVLSKNIPQYVVIILGESFARSHSSLYGYEKETNPRLTQLHKDSLLFIYNNAIAPATNTIPCIKSIMSTYRTEYGDSAKWYECETLPQIMSEAGFNTLWISNQSKSGMFDNIAAKYAELCNRQVWCGNQVKGTNKADYDGIILDSLLQNRLLDKESEKHFIVIHLMGSHTNYKLRYPSEWNTFLPKDYSTDLNSNSVLAAYDNSVLYNDFVVSELFNHFSDKEAILFYFSDHGQDLFDSSEDYFGHSKTNNKISQKVGLEIPFMVYCSPLFQNRFPIETKAIKNDVNQMIYTEEIIEYITELLGLHIQ